MGDLFQGELWAEVLETVRRNRLRTALTLLGVFWGMLMLVLMYGFGNGLEDGVVRSLGDNATNAVYLWGRRSTLPYQGNQPGRSVDFTTDDVGALRSRVPEIEYLCPRNQLGGYRSGNVVRHRDKVGSFNVMADVPEYRHVFPMQIPLGRFINPEDMTGARKVAVIGAQVRDELFGPGVDPVGEHVEIQGVWFQVVGMFDAPGSGDDADRAESTVHIPFRTFQQAFNTGDEVSWFALTATAGANGEEVEAAVRKVLAERHGLHPDDEPAMGSFNAEAEFRRIRNTFAGVRAFVWLVGGATLLTGVFGVSNILLVSIRERTPEIGLRRAVGARPGQVVVQVMLEALLLTSLAGMAGLVVGVGALALAARLIGPDREMMGPPEIDLSVALVATLVMVLGGLLAGVVPARRAAAIRPVDALRGE
ncbi:MAG: ABC transporter permease [Alphaproteobacteria bacterium]|nr:ABC transporter permease [Alphaproteobacteria bacterium]